MRKRNLLLIAILFIFLIVGIFAHAIYMDQVVWREDATRYSAVYDLKVTGLSGKEVQGTTMIMVPIPASKEGKFFTPPAQKEPYFTQKLKYKVQNMPEQYYKGPYFRNMTEIFDNKEISGNWTSFIAETDKGYMLGFRTNETRLEDIKFSAGFVADHFDIFDPINNGSPILFPVENISNISSVPYGDYTKYTSSPTYDTYVYLSDNLKGGEMSFNIHLDANNDPTEWTEKYRGRYLNLLLANVSDTGYVKVRVFLGQEIPLRANSVSSVWESQYVKDYYDNKTSHVVNETYRYPEVAI